MRAWLILLAFLVCAACGGAAPATGPLTAVPAASPAAFPLTISDDRGTSRTFATAPTRVVSLAPSATEIMYALGAGSLLIATDDFSDFPPEAKALPKLGGSRASPERIVAQRADVIIAITQGTVTDQLVAQGQPVFILDPVGLAGVYKNVEQIGAIIGKPAEARALAASMRTRIDAIAEKARTSATKPRVMHEIDSTDPARVFVAGPGSFIDEIITAVGGRNIASAAQQKYPRFSPEEIVRGDPEVIILSDAKFGATPEAVAARPGYANISAVRAKRVLPIDDDLVSRPGPRLVDGVEAMAKLVHPELFR